MNDHQMESKTVRNRFIDIAKALGILLIVWGHSGGWGPLGNAMYVINTFHVPLFFFLSALFMTTALSFAEFSKKRAIRLLKPYLIFGLIASFVYYLVTDNDIIKIGGGIPWQFVRFGLGMRGEGYIFSGALWFLPSLFASLILCYTALKYFSRHLVLFSVIMMSASILTSYFKIILPFNIDISFFMVPIMLAAYKYKTEILSHNYNWKIAALCLTAIIAYVGMLYFTGISSINFYGNTLGFVPLSIVTACCGIYIILWISQCLERWLKGRPKAILYWIGENTIVFLVIHQTLIIHPLNMWNAILQYPILSGCIRFSIILVICTISALVINRYLPKLIK